VEKVRSAALGLQHLGVKVEHWCEAKNELIEIRRLDFSKMKAAGARLTLSRKMGMHAILNLSSSWGFFSGSTCPEACPDVAAADAAEDCSAELAVVEGAAATLTT
jgi:hypothetical protein